MRVQRKQQIRTIIISANIMYLLWVFYLSLNLFFLNQGARSLAGIGLLSVEQTAHVLLCLTISVIILNIYLSHEWVNVEKTERKLAEEKMSRELSEQNLRLLRCQRHDFLNHLQVILGYLQFQKTDRAVNYIKSINNELKEVRAISGLSMPEASVLLMAKREEAERHNIKFEYDIKTGLDGVKVREHDLVKILSNLVDNAIYELKNLNTEAEKKIKIMLEEVGETLFVEVFNTETFISNREQVFRYGYTSKGDEGTGTGLYIVKDLVENKYRGKVEVESEKDSGTRFKIAL